MVQSALDYAWTSILSNPFTAITFLTSLLALLISLRARSFSKHQAHAAKVQEEEAKRIRELNQRALTWQADTLKIQAESCKALADAAARTVEAAEKSAKAAEHSSKLSVLGQRAWVSCKKIKAQVNPDYRNVSVLTTVVNTGKTAAVNLAVHQQLRVMDRVPANNDYSAPAAVSKGPLGPNQVTELSNALQLSEPEYASVNAEKSAVYLYGFARYQDIFGENHETKWCLKYSPSTEQFDYLSPRNGSKQTQRIELNLVRSPKRACPPAPGA